MLRTMGLELQILLSDEEAMPKLLTPNTEPPSHQLTPLVEIAPSGPPSPQNSYELGAPLIIKQKRDCIISRLLMNVPLC